MKKIHIIIIFLIAILIAAILTTLSDSSTYANFDEAINHPGKEFHIVGKLNKQKGLMYNPKVNANLFKFFMIDKKGKEMEVFYNGAKPYDFERSEQIVVVGKYDKGKFVSTQILLKCPSKYNASNQ